MLLLLLRKSIEVKFSILSHRSLEKFGGQIFAAFVAPSEELLDFSSRKIDLLARNSNLSSLSIISSYNSTRRDASRLVSNNCSLRGLLETTLRLRDSIPPQLTNIIARRQRSATAREPRPLCLGGAWTKGGGKTLIKLSNCLRKLESVIHNWRPSSAQTTALAEHNRLWRHKTNLLFLFLVFLSLRADRLAC